MVLSLSSRNGARIQIADGARVPIEGEREWYASGTVDELAVLVGCVGRSATKIRDDLWLLDFRNQVGLFPLADGVLEVRSGKWSVADFDSALDDLFRVASDLPFHGGESSPLPVMTDEDVPNDVLYRAFLYLRASLLNDAPRCLATALHAVARDPHRRFERHEVVMPLAMVRDVRFDRLSVYLASARRWETGTHGLEALGMNADGAVPADLPESRVRDTFDTAENRFVRAFVDSAVSLVDGTVQAVSKKACAARVEEDARTMLALLDAARTKAPLADVGRLTQVPLGSSALQRRRGYRDILHHFVRLRHAVKGLPFSADAFDALLEGRDVAHVYELWAFFQVVEELRALLGVPTVSDAPRRDDLGVSVGRLVVAWGTKIKVTYQQSFTPSQGTSYSLQYQPDVSLLADGRLHLFDAKFRLAASTGGAAERSFRNDDIAKMHAYRDAIRNARSAWVMHPGTGFVFYNAATGLESALGVDAEGVGAISLRPDHDNSDLRRVLRGLLGMQTRDGSTMAREGVQL